MLCPDNFCQILWFSGFQTNIFHRRLTRLSDLKTFSHLNSCLPAFPKTTISWHGIFPTNFFRKAPPMVELRLITTSAFAEVRFRRDVPCVSSLGLPTGKRNSSTGEHIHIFPRMLVFVSGAGIRAEKSHTMPINSILVQMSHNELPTSTRRCFAYQFRLPSMKRKHIMTSPGNASI